MKELLLEKRGAALLYGSVWPISTSGIFSKINHAIGDLCKTKGKTLERAEGIIVLACQRENVSRGTVVICYLPLEIECWLLKLESGAGRQKLVFKLVGNIPNNFISKAALFLRILIVSIPGAETKGEIVSGKMLYFFLFRGKIDW